jgi:hypothetical protein
VKGEPAKNGACEALRELITTRYVHTQCIMFGVAWMVCGWCVLWRGGWCECVLRVACCVLRVAC